jgi:hypothetical protein
LVDGIMDRMAMTFIVLLYYYISEEEAKNGWWIGWAIDGSFI